MVVISSPRRYQIHIPNLDILSESHNRQYTTQHHIVKAPSQKYRYLIGSESHLTGLFNYVARGYQNAYKPETLMEVPESMMPLFGRTQYLRGAVVLTLKHTFLSVGLVSFRVAVTTSVNGPEEDREKQHNDSKAWVCVCVCRFTHLSTSLVGAFVCHLGAWLRFLVKTQD